MTKKKIKEIEVSPEVLEEKIEKKKASRSAFNQAAIKGNSHLLFFWLSILMFIWFAFSILEIGIRLIIATIQLFKDPQKNKHLINTIKAIVLPIGYIFGCLVGIFSPNKAIHFLQKVDQLCPEEPPPVFIIIQALFRRYRR